MLKNINSDEVKRILSLHESFKKKIVKEQTQPSTSTKRTGNELIEFFGIAKNNRCLIDPNLVYDKPKRTEPETRGYIAGPSQSMEGMQKRVYDDFTWVVVDPTTKAILKQGTWVCKALEPKEVKPDSNKLNNNQLKVLDIIKAEKWFAKPAPTQVEIDNGTYKSMNIADPNTELGKTYSKYFTDFLQDGFYVYQKKEVDIPNPKEVTKVEITAESCKASIESLWNHLKSPKTYPLTQVQIDTFKNTAETCAEPANKSKFLLRFGLKNKLEDLVNSRLRVRSRL